jgi:hypothetical protein
MCNVKGEVLNTVISRRNIVSFLQRTGMYFTWQEKGGPKGEGRREKGYTTVTGDEQFHGNWRGV